MPSWSSNGGYTSLSPSSSSSSSGLLLPPTRGPLLRRYLPLAIVILLSISLLSSVSHPLQPIAHLLPSSLSPSSHPPTLSHSSPSSSTRHRRPQKPIPHGKHPISNGMLEVDMRLSAKNHPIHQLIQDAKGEWDAKIQRQSTDLKGAVTEYRRRHGGRNPPKGFDKWWDYQQTHNVPLPDEYDRIMVDLGPFRGFSPKTLKSRILHLQTLDSTFSLSVTSGVLKEDHDNFDKKKYFGSQARAQGQFDFIKDVAQWIPDFVAVLSIHDVPTQFVSWDHLEELRRLDEAGEYFDPEDVADKPFTGWAAACAPGTHLYNQTLQEAISRLPPHTSDSPAPPPLTRIPPHYHAPDPDPSVYLARPLPPHGKAKSFISNLTSAMDMCAHPEVLPLHGTTAGREPEPSAVLMPMFSLSKTNLHSDIMVIPIEQWAEPTGAMHWNEKEEGRVLWRGRNTGMQYTSTTPWRSSHRARLARMASLNLTNNVEVLPSPPIVKLHLAQLDAMYDIVEDAGRAEELAEEQWTGDRRRSRQQKRAGVGADLAMKDALLGIEQGPLNERLLDVGLAYTAIQCDQEDGTCDDITRELTFKPLTTFDHENHYRYILDIDGNAWSARFHRLLNSNALVLKSTIYPEWWNDRIQPWVHYVPVKVDYEDLYDIMAFFQGDLDQFEGENLMARAIAEAGREWSLTHWRREDMTAYMFRLYLEWARLLAPDRKLADYVIEDDPKYA